MTIPPRTLRWTCPHCRRGSMKLHSAQRHLRLHHWDCWSCRMEAMLITKMQAGEGFFSRQPMWMIERPVFGQPS